MKHSPSLEQERQALLAQIQSSRAVYRRMLAEADAPYQAQDTGTGRANAIGATLTEGAGSAKQWAKRHPGLVAAGMAGAIAALLLARRRNRQRAKSLAQTRHVAPTRGKQLLKEQSAVPRVARGVLVSSLAGLAQGMLRNPARMQYAARSVAVVMRYIRRWRNSAAARSAQVRNEAKMDSASGRGVVRDGRYKY